MTREEARKCLNPVFSSNEYNDDTKNRWIDSFVALGMLKLDNPMDSDRIAAIDRLYKIHVGIDVIGRGFDNTITGQLSLDGAAEVLDVLIKSGFKITR